MADKEKLIEQTRLAFDFIGKLYLEVSYLVKEIEGILADELEEFTIGKPAGYGISVKSSTGLESTNVKLWLSRKFAVFFIPKGKTKISGGQTHTPFDQELKVLYQRFVLDESDTGYPAVYSGVIYDIKNNNSKWSKFEQMMGPLQYQDTKIFLNPNKVEYEHPSVALKGEFILNSLFEINDTQTIHEKIVKPSLALYRKC